MSDVLSTPRASAEPWSWLPDGADVPTDEQLAAARAETAAMLADRGVTYGAHATADDAESWRLDPSPVVVEESEWTRLDAAVAQRAQVLDLLLADLYGERRLLATGVLPPEVVLAHPGFLRAVDGLRVPGRHQLVLTATDLVRGADGTWLAAGDRTQAPSGAGYAMVDRRVAAQSMARVYRQASIRRLGPFFHELRQALTDVAPDADRAPRIVLLTSGPHSETAFDQAYLATMLGLPLVEGADLSVRDGRVWMQGIDGVEQVDVVLRRVDAEWCDPLDLRSDSRLGTPGLVRALRAGTVAVVNPLGSSVLESPGVAAYLPRVARAVIGEDLALPSPTTHWLGDASSRGVVLAHLDRWVLRPTSVGVPSHGALDARPVPGWLLDEAGRDELAARIAADPAAWAAQEPAPGEVEAADRAALLRTFAVGRGGAYRVMAGGLALVAPDDAQRVVSSHLGAVARDVWVIASEPEAAAGPAESEGLGGRADEAGRAGRPVPAGISVRTAENMFWMGRYAERAGDTVRTLRATVDRWDDFARTPETPGGRALRVLLDAMGAELPPGWTATPRLTGTEEPGARRALRRMLVDRSAPGSVAWSVRRLGDAAAAVRDQLSTDGWLPLASLDRTLAQERAITTHPSTQQPAVEPRLRVGSGTRGMVPILDRLLEALLAVAGMAAEGMVRDAGWYLLDAGRRIERAQHLVDSLDGFLGVAQPEDVEELLVESVLLAHESAITYRRRHQSGAGVAAVLDLLLTDRGNPRALAFQLDRLRDDLAQVPSTGRSTETRDRLLGDVTDLVTELDTRAAADAVGPDARRTHLAETLESVRWRLRALGEEIERVHFAQQAPSQALGDAWGIA